MSRIDSSSGTSNAFTTQTKGNGFNDISSGQFLELLINELQNQDPLNPMDNSQMIEQIAQIRSIGSTDTLTSTLSTLRESQELVTASAMIGQTVEGLTDTGTNLKGKVDRVSVEINEKNKERKVKVHVGEQTMEINNIRTIRTE